MLYILLPTTKERRNRFNVFYESLKNNDYPYTLCIYEGSDGGCVKAIQKMVKGINGLILPLADDMILDKDYLKTLMEVYNKNFPNKEGIVQGYEPAFKGKMIQNPLCHSDIFKKYYHFEYSHNYADKDFTEAVIKDKIPWIYVPEAQLKHMHYTRGLSEFDETYKISSSSYKSDRNLFYKRRAEGFIND